MRAVWSRDQDGAQPAATDITTPFRTSLEGADRTTLVTESSDSSVAVTEPVAAKRLYLSSQGAWLGLHGTWDTTPYSMPNPIDSWDHIAGMGRDQYVKVSHPGYLFPFGHKASLIKVTERRIDASTQPEGYLYQRFFIVVREPVKNYGDQTMPLSQVQFRTLVTPKLDPIADETLFWPTVAGAKFEFALDTFDRAGSQGHAARAAGVRRYLTRVDVGRTRTDPSAVHDPRQRAVAAGDSRRLADRRSGRAGQAG